MRRRGKLTSNDRPRWLASLPGLGCLLALLAAGPALAQGAPGKGLDAGETKKVCDALKKLKCAVDSMPEGTDDEKKMKEKAKKAHEAAKAAKDKKGKDGKKDPRYRKRKLGKDHFAYTSPEQDDGTSVSGTEAVGEGGEYVVVSETELGGSENNLGALLAHEGSRLTSKYKYPKKRITVAEYCKVLDRTIEAWSVHIAVLEAMKKKLCDEIDDRQDGQQCEDTQQLDGNGESGEPVCVPLEELEDEKKKVCERLEVAKKAKKGKEKAKEKLGC